MHHNTRGVLLEADRAARQRALELVDRQKLHWSFIVDHYPLTTIEMRESRRLRAAMTLATDADTFVALAHNRPVPAAALNQRFLKAHERRIRVR